MYKNHNNSFHNNRGAKREGGRGREKASRCAAGFTLIELSIVIVILGILLGSFLTVSSSSKEHEALIKAKEQMKEIEEALAFHYRKRGYLPCPASATAAENSSSFGIATDCSTSAPSGTHDTGSGDDAIRIGVVPVRSLGLPDYKMYDPWRSRITYATIKKLATNSSDFSSYSTTSTDGVITILDREGDQVTEASNDTIVAYILVMHGKDREGGYRRNGAVGKSCNSSRSLEYENCSHSLTSPVVDAEFTDSPIVDSEVDSKYFYDIVRWKIKGMF